MKDIRRKVFMIGFFVFISSAIFAQGKKPEFETPAHMLVFSKTSGFRHESLTSGIKMLLTGQPNGLIDSYYPPSKFDFKTNRLEIKNIKRNARIFY